MKRIILFFIFTISFASIVFVQPRNSAEAAVNLVMNYQGKLTNTSNVAVADGTYNMEFKLYDAAGSGCSPTGGSLLWTETRTGGNKVQVTNGIFSVMLGDVTALTSVDFNQTLYLSVNIGGTGTPSWDGEMCGRKKIGTVPAAFLANTLEGTGKIDITNTSTNQQTINYDGSNRLTVGVASNGFTTLTAVGAGAGFNLTGGNVGIGTASTSAKLHVTATTEQLRLGYDAGNYASFTTSSGGDLTIAPSGSDLAVTGNVDVSGSLNAGTADAFVVSTAGLITAGTWQATAVVDTYIADTLTVDSSSSVHWNALNNYPAACGAGSAISQLADTTNTCTSFNTDTSITLQDAYVAGATISTTGSNIGLTLNSSQGLTVTTAATGTGFSTFSLADGSNATPPAQLVLIDNADTNQAVASGLKITSAAGTITSGIDLTDTDIGDAITLGNNNITGAGFSVTSTASGLTLNSTSAALALTTTTSGNITFAPASTGSVQLTSGVTTGTGTSGGLSVASSTITSGDLVSLSQTTSSYTGTGLKMNWASGSTATFADFQINGTTRFKINYGSVTGNGATAIAGIFQDLVQTNSSASADQYQFGNRLLNTISSTKPGYHVGQFIRVTDSTVCGSNSGACTGTNSHVIRGLEVQAYSGTNNYGINTGIQTYGKTYGLSAETTAQAGSTALPAAVIAYLNNATGQEGVGNAIRATTDKATSADLVQIYHETSAYTGSGLLFDMANGSGTFVGNFADMRVAGTSKLKFAYSTTSGKLTQTYNATGSIVDFSSGTNGNTFIWKVPQKATTGTCASAAAEGIIFQNTGGTQVGHMCIDGPTSGTPNKLRFYAEQFSATSTDVAENYTDTSGMLEAGDVVKVDSSADKAVTKSQPGDKGLMAGVISTSPGVLLSGISESTGETDLINPKPVALVGRVPVKVTNENGPIKAGDLLAVSKILAGYAMKATEPGPIIGQALASMNDSLGSVEMFVNPTMYTGFAIDSQDDGLAFDYGETAETGQNIPEFETDEGSMSDLEDAASEGGLAVYSGATFKDGLRVDSIGAIGSSIAFRSDVVFFGRPYFTTDTAGFAQINEGDRSVRITFEKEYLDQPIVNTSIAMEGDDNPEMQALQEEMAELLFEEGLQYLVVNKTINGFTIIMNKPAPRDLTFSWTALAVKNPRLFVSGEVAGEEVVEDSGEVSGAEDINDTTDSSPTQQSQNPDDQPAFVEGDAVGNSEQTQADTGETTGKTTEAGDSSITTESPEISQ